MIDVIRKNRAIKEIIISGIAPFPEIRAIGNKYTSREKNLILSTEYGGEITAMVKKENIIGTQFHPEKSHLFGLKFLETFIEIN